MNRFLIVLSYAGWNLSPPPYTHTKYILGTPSLDYLHSLTVLASYVR